MSLKAFKRKGKEKWNEETFPLKHSTNPKDAKRLREEVKLRKKLAHRQERREGKREIEEETR
jgi:hypothetical protein